MYTMKTRGNETTFSKNERKCAATICFIYKLKILLFGHESCFSFERNVQLYKKVMLYNIYIIQDIDEITHEINTMQ